MVQLTEEWRFMIGCQFMHQVVAEEQNPNAEKLSLTLTDENFQGLLSQEQQITLSYLVLSTLGMGK